MVVVNNFRLLLAAGEHVLFLLHIINIWVEQVVDLLVPGAVQQHDHLWHLPPQQRQPVLSCQVGSVPEQTKYDEMRTIFIYWEHMRLP